MRDTEEMSEDSQRQAHVDQRSAEDPPQAVDEKKEAENSDAHSVGPATGESRSTRREGRKKKKKSRTKQAHQPEEAHDSKTWPFDGAFSHNDKQIQIPRIPSYQAEPAYQQQQQVMQNSEGASKGDGGGSRALSVRLDLNLEIEIELKARIHGDLTLTLL